MERFGNFVVRDPVQPAMRQHRNTVGAIVMTAAAAITVHAQAPQFEAAVFRLNTSGAGESSVQQRPGGQYLMVNGTIGILLLNAFRPENRDIVNAPTWVATEHYDLTARANATTTSDDLRLMLRALLAERLKLSAHLEPREQPVYFLMLARPDGRLGPKIERTPRD